MSNISDDAAAIAAAALTQAAMAHSAARLAGKSVIGQSSAGIAEGLYGRFHRFVRGFDDSIVEPEAPVD